MLRTVALARLRLLTAATSEPVISDTDLGVHLDMWALADANSVAPDQPGWLGAWDITSAARAVWRDKAGRVVSDVTYQADDATYNQSDMYKHCLEMANRMVSTGTLGVG